MLGGGKREESNRTYLRALSTMQVAPLFRCTVVGKTLRKRILRSTPLASRGIAGLRHCIHLLLEWAVVKQVRVL
jgi:hypothetical protein